jgi:D-alanine-D-alanine ligase
MRIGIAYDLKSDFEYSPSLAEDCLEEYDSEDTVDAIAGALRHAGHEVKKLGGGRKFISAAMRASAEREIDLVFNIAEGAGSRSREAHVPAVCEMLGIPFTHSDPLTLALTLDKALTKRIVTGQGVPTAPFALIEKIQDLERVELPKFPVIAKPNCEGSSIGVRKHSRCEDIASLRDRVTDLLSAYSQPVLVERLLTGTEVTVGILGSGEGAKCIGMMEIAPKKCLNDRFVYSLEVKRNWREEVEYYVPPRLDSQTQQEIENVALGAYRALGCRDVSRVDVRLDGENKPNLIEVNPLPGLNPVTGDLVILAARSGMPYERMIDEIVQNAISRISTTASLTA